MNVLVLAPRPPEPPLDGLGLPLHELSTRLREQIDLRLVVPRPTSTRSRGSARLRGPLAAELAASEPDVVHVFSGRLAGLAPAIGARPSVLTALDAWHRNVEAQAAVAAPLRAVALRARAWWVRRSCATHYPAFDRTVTVTDEDAAALRALEPSIRTVVIPNGVDAEHYAPPAPPRRDDGLLVMHGVMDYAPNVAAAVDLATQVLPRVRGAVPAARLALVGRSPAPEVRALAADPAVEVTGEVDDVRPWLHRAGVYVCPMRTGTGIKNKVLEALAAGAAVVATPLAVQGLDVRPGEHLLVADAPTGVAEAVVGLLEDPGRRDRLGEAGRRFVGEHHTWDAVARAYFDLYAAVVAEHGG